MEIISINRSKIQAMGLATLRDKFPIMGSVREHTRDSIFLNIYQLDTPWRRFVHAPTESSPNSWLRRGMALQLRKIFVHQIIYNKRRS